MGVEEIVVLLFYIYTYFYDPVDNNKQKANLKECLPFNGLLHILLLGDPARASLELFQNLLFVRGRDLREHEIEGL